MASKARLAPIRHPSRATHRADRRNDRQARHAECVEPIVEQG